MKYTCCILAVLICTGFRGIGQENDRGKLLEEMRKMQLVYTQANTLSFDIKYVYATEDKPGEYLDSLNGKMDLAGSSFRLVLSNTETIKNDKFIIHVFHDDKLIYISKPASDPAANPIALLDSSFAGISGLTYKIEESQGTRSITLNFPPDHTYKSIRFMVNSATGFISRMRYVVKTEQLTQLKENGTGPADYSVVESFFSNYTAKEQDRFLFDETKYFLVQDNEYKPSENYKDYSIFFGSPNF